MTERLFKQLEIGEGPKELGARAIKQSICSASPFCSMQSQAPLHMADNYCIKKNTRIIGQHTVHTLCFNVPMFLADRYMLQSRYDAQPLAHMLGEIYHIFI